MVEFKKQSIVIELKIFHPNQKTLQEGLEQTAAYMNTKGATEGYLIIFDRSKEKSWDQKIFRKTEKVGSLTIEVWGM